MTYQFALVVVLAALLWSGAVFSQTRHFPAGTREVYIANVSGIRTELLQNIAPTIEKSISKGFMHYWSRSRNKLWLKGETSGNVQKIVRWFVDCDRDTLLFHVEQKGSACHSGFESCFFSELDAKKATNTTST